MTRSSRDITLALPPPRFEGSWGLAKLSIRIFGQSGWFIAKAALPLYLPLEILKVRLIPEGENNAMALFRYERFMNGFFGLFLELVILYGVAQFLKTKTFPALKTAYAFGIKKWFHLFGQNFIAGLLTLLGLVMLVVPGLALIPAYCLILPVVGFEGSKKQNWLGRSRTLTLGRRKLILLSAALLFLISLVVWGILAALLNLAFSFTGIPSLGDAAADTLEDVLLNVFVVWALLVYLRARRDKGKKPKELWFLKWAR